MPSKSGKKSASKKPASRSTMSAADHRKLADMHHAKGSLHRAKAALLEVQNPSKKTPRVGTY